HTDCQGIGEATYDRLSDSRHVWICLKCCLPSYSSTLLESLDTLSDSNNFSLLDPENLGEATGSPVPNISVASLHAQKSLSGNSDHLAPKATSTPKQTKTKRHTPKVTSQSKERLTVLNINCRSIKNKIPELHQVIDQTKPDIIACTETWLTPEISSSEIFPDSLGYTVIRNDRKSGKGGGVLLAVSK
ncbi:MAG: hypothetical protein JAZ03_21505, partial [Candidatus Thiodiazotropha taylori]|nr:hypothetical protein [Candidatus Thiodiazotropha taylori]MCW4336504.1 hypothetical protein [Candidatus Thiodiazotropha endolucinida]